ncbi:LacI family DNA-binding transcriptional regulator [Catenulispora rubra]|uniref:LacI family DNA-binding transcriptional regulator n=1 Tax=Catenulispora rubra TaxID=280293 RepID=UPI001E63B163|nr:LacI family DNA-binding transcriptional regulator [Catenulispora rubra]
MQEVAERAGVTKQTVSNVVSGRGRVSTATAARVQAAIDELGYVPNLVARSLATGATMTVALVVPSVANPFYSEVVEEVENALREQGYHLLLGTTRQDAGRARELLTSLAGRSVDALLIAGDHDLEDHLALLADARFPVALCAWENDIPHTLPVVTIDYDNGGFLAGRHLRELGHERIAVVAEMPHHAPRVEGARRAFARDGLTIPDEAIFVSDPSRPEHEFEVAEQVFDSSLRLTAVFATRDVLALRILEAARLRGLAVPGDISIVGFDDIAEVGSAHPPLTTVAIPTRSMARQSVELLLRSVADSMRPDNTMSLLRPRLIVRSSTGPAPRAAD